MNRQPLPHLSLQRYGTYSLKPEYRCPICQNLLWTECSQRTHGQTWFFTEGFKQRHLKTKCNLGTPEQFAAYLAQKSE